eukprot:TRINITY_DN40282_c0_g1_i1.p1 TRINITY_DN40282_c0_g1~~TRINITY_DN40282_c0_g1_i1.p1  ORF type:complete len:829 (+),score=252.11 TRINITY_DN40282_c0_g1_i1:82-2568(+)
MRAPRESPGLPALCCALLLCAGRDAPRPAYGAPSAPTEAPTQSPLFPTGSPAAGSAPAGGSGAGSAAGAGLADCPSSGSGQSMFDAERDMIEQPWHVFFMFLLVIGISVAHEVFFHWVDHKVEQMHSGSSEKLKAMIQHEVMNLGLIGLWLTFMQEVGFSHEYWSVGLFHYTHFILFVMMMVFMALCAFLLWSMRLVWKTWVRYEQFSTMVKDDPSMPEGQKELTLAMYWQRNMNAKRITNCLKLFERTVPDRYASIPFTRYLRKSQRRHLLGILNLNKWAWLTLSLLLFLIAMLLHYKNSKFRDGWRDMTYFIGFVGYGSLLAVSGLCLKVWRAFRHFCGEIDVISVSFKNVYRGPPPTPNVRKYFWLGRPSFTIQLLQSMLLLQVFYTAIVTVDVVPHVLNNEYWATALLAVLPTILIFGVCLPAMMPRFSCLASLGEFLDERLLDDMKRSAVVAAVSKLRDLDDLFGDDGSPRASAAQAALTLEPAASSGPSPAVYCSAAGEGPEAAAAARMRLVSDLGAHLALLSAAEGADAMREATRWMANRRLTATAGDGSPGNSPRRQKCWGQDKPPPQLQLSRLKRKEREMLRYAQEEYEALLRRGEQRAALGAPDLTSVQSVQSYPTLSPWRQQQQPACSPGPDPSRGDATPPAAQLSAPLLPPGGSPRGGRRRESGGQLDRLPVPCTALADPRAGWRSAAGRWARSEAEAPYSGPSERSSIPDDAPRMPLPQPPPPPPDPGCAGNGAPAAADRPQPPVRSAPSRCGSSSGSAGQLAGVWSSPVVPPAALPRQRHAPRGEPQVRGQDSGALRWAAAGSDSDGPESSGTD